MEDAPPAVRVRADACDVDVAVDTAIADDEDEERATDDKVDEEDACDDVAVDAAVADDEDDTRRVEEAEVEEGWWGDSGQEQGHREGHEWTVDTQGCGHGGEQQSLLRITIRKRNVPQNPRQV